MFENKFEAVEQRKIIVTIFTQEKTSMSQRLNRL